MELGSTWWTSLHRLGIQKRPKNLFLASAETYHEKCLMANVSVLLKLGGYLSLTSRQLQMLTLDTGVAASPGIVKGS